MSDFDLDFSGASDAFDDAFGDLVTYTPMSGTAMTFSAIKTDNAQIIGSDLETVYLGTTFEFNKSDFMGNVSRGDTILRGTETYTVESQTAEDDYNITVLVK